MDQVHNPPNCESIYGIPVSFLTKDKCLLKISNWIKEGKFGRTIVCSNPHSLEVCLHDGLFRKALLSADLVIPDGIGVVLASRIFGGQIHERVTGSDIFLGLNHLLNRKAGRSIFFLGSTNETLKAMQRRFVNEFPMVQVAGIYSPPFRVEFDEIENQAMVKAVNAVRPDVLWVGMTAPKQEKWLFRNRNMLMVGVSVAIGAVFDFYANNVQRPSHIFQHIGLEWILRVIQEPRRLGSRIPSNLRFMGRILKQKLTCYQLKRK